MGSEQRSRATVRFRGMAGPWSGWQDDRARAEALVARMTLEEKLALVSVPMATGPDAPAEAIGSAAHCPGVPRLRIPAWDESDASLGITNPHRIRGEHDEATAFPSTIALGATFDVDLARRMGRALGEEARQKGFSVLLAGGMNLIREPRGGRIFEYISEDVLLTGLIAGAQVAGIQAEGVVSTLKHFAINPQETGRVMVSSDIGEPALRESDLLAFEIALEHGRPRAVMTGYNLVNGKYAAENAFLIQEVLKGDWGFAGFVMSDWGATHSTEHAAWAGLDRQCGHQLDTEHYFGPPLRRAVESGRVTTARLDDMVARILTAMSSVGALGDRRRAGELSLAAHADVARTVAQRSIVLLRNEGDALPLTASGGRIVVTGGRSDVGVLCGGGSSTVTPTGSSITSGLAVPQADFPRVHHRPSPLEAITSAFPGRQVVHLDPAEAMIDLRGDDVAVVVVETWACEGQDAPSLDAGAGQDDLVRRAAAIAGRTVVVLETAGPVLMPWLEEADAVIAAWYGGSQGAAAIAGVLSGDVVPAGRLPVTFPLSEDVLPRIDMIDPESTTSAPGAPRVGGYLAVDYDIEGADVGYRWFERTGASCLFPFGHGLSYTRFAYSDIEVRAPSEGGDIEVSLTVTNVGERSGVEVPQVYVAPPAPSSGTFRLAGFMTIELEPGGSQTVRLVLDEDRVYSSYDADRPGWTRAEGMYRVRVARAAAGVVEHEADLHLSTRRHSVHVTG